MYTLDNLEWQPNNSNGMTGLARLVSEEDAYAHNFTDEDEKRLADALKDDWDNLDDYSKVVYHIIKDTSNLPRWRKPYPPTQEHIHSLKEFLDINPQSNVK